jgi:hypothetical protein
MRASGLSFLAFASLAACGGGVDNHPVDACNCSFDAGAPTPPPALPPASVPPPDGGGPPPQTGPTVLVFAGDGPAFLDDTWTFDGTTWASHATAAPSSRMRHAMAPRAGNIVLFGGAHIASTYLADTWEWDGAHWSDHSTASGPSPRGDHAMALLGDAVILYGGEGSGTSSNAGSETWSWDGTTWTQKAEAGPNPGWRVGHAMATLGGKVVLFGGVGGGTDTWEFDGQSWTKKTIPGPSERAFFAMTTLNNKIVLFGGEHDANHYENDTWEYDGTTWTQRTDATGPTARFHHGMTTLGGKAVLFGGESPVGVSPPWLGDTWSWDGTRWTQSPATGPGGRDVYTIAAP